MPPENEDEYTPEDEYIPEDEFPPLPDGVPLLDREYVGLITRDEIKNKICELIEYKLRTDYDSVLPIVKEITNLYESELEDIQEDIDNNPNEQHLVSHVLADDLLEEIDKNPKDWPSMLNKLYNILGIFNEIYVGGKKIKHSRRKHSRRKHSRRKHSRRKHKNT